MRVFEKDAHMFQSPQNLSNSGIILFESLNLELGRLGLEQGVVGPNQSTAVHP